MNSPFNLREKTIFLAGPMTPMMQSLTIGLTQLGADLGLVNLDVDTSRRFAAQMMDAREINSAYGRAFAIETDFNDEEQVKEAISRIAETFGGIDTYIDTRSSFNLAWGKSADTAIDSEIRIVESKSLITAEVLPFLKGRKRGRILYIGQKSLFEAIDSDFCQAQTTLEKQVTQLGEELFEFNVGANMLTINLTEEYLLFHKPGRSIQEALEEFHKEHAGMSVTEFERITNAVAFLVSSMAIGITGQNIYIR